MFATPNKKKQINFERYYKDWYGFINQLKDIKLAPSFIGDHLNMEMTVSVKMFMMAQIIIGR